MTTAPEGDTRLLRRRSLLAPLALGLALLGALGWRRRSVRPARSPKEARAFAARLAALLDASGELESLAELRRKMSTRTPGASELLDALFPTFDAATLATWSDDHIRQALSRAIESDFEQGRITNVGGWLLSNTEAHLSSLRLALLAELD